MLIHFLTFFMVMFLFHAFDDFFCLDLFAQNLHHIHDFAVRILRIFQSFFDPFVGFTADINEKVRLGNLQNIFRGRFKTV